MGRVPANHPSRATVITKQLPRILSTYQRKVLKRGGSGRKKMTTRKYTGPKLEVPLRIEDRSDNITQKILTSKSRADRINLPHSLKFYREMGIPLPRCCFDQRHEDRRKKRNPGAVDREWYELQKSDSDELRTRKT